MNLNGMNITQAGSGRAGGAGGGFISNLLNGVMGMQREKHMIDYRATTQKDLKTHSVDENIRERSGKNNADLDMQKTQSEVAQARFPEVYPDTYEEGHVLAGQPHAQAGQPHPRAGKLMYPDIAEKLQRQTKLGSMSWAAPIRETSTKESAPTKPMQPFSETEPLDALRANNEYVAKGRKGWVSKPESIRPLGQIKNKKTGAWEDVKDSEGNTSGPLYTKDNQHEDDKDLAQWKIKHGGKE